MNSASTSTLVSDRIGRLTRWLEEQAPYAEFDQRHLDSGTPEQAYWHLGYRAALHDVMSLLMRDLESKRGTANRFPSDDRGD